LYFRRGFFIIVLLTVFKSSLIAGYLYKDEIIFNSLFKSDIEKLGSELYQKTGVSLRLIMLKKLPDNTNIVAYEKELIKDFNEPTILLTFSEIDLKVDILANDTSYTRFLIKNRF